MKLISINNRRYIGSKARMLDYINDVMKKEKITFSSFFDLFGGTGIVGDYFNDSKTKIYVNDLLKSNYLSYLAWFGNDKIRSSCRILITLIRYIPEIKRETTINIKVHISRFWKW